MTHTDVEESLHNPYFLSVVLGIIEGLTDPTHPMMRELLAD